MEKYGREGSARGTARGRAANGARVVVVDGDSSGTIRCTSADSP